MKRVLFAAAAALLLLSAAAQEEKPSESKAQEAKPAEEAKIPPEAAQKPNPVKPTEASLEAGKKFYSTQCVMCHGKEGDGKGDLAKEMDLKLRDYRQPEALKGLTDGELFYILSTGRGKMPGQGSRMPEEQKWNVVNYLRSLAKPKAAASSERTVVGGVLGGVAAESPAKPDAPRRIVVGSRVAEAKIIDKPLPAYPREALAARIAGVVRLKVLISEEGNVRQIEVISGHPLLVKAAVDAVKRWRYQQTLLNGELVEVETVVDVTFSLNP